MRPVHHVMRDEGKDDGEENNGRQPGIEHGEIDKAEHPRHGGADHVHVLSTDAIGDVPEEWNRKEREHGSCEHGGKQKIA